MVWKSFLKFIGTKAFLPNNDFHRQFRKIVCERSMREATVCRNMIFLIAGTDPDNFNLVTPPSEFNLK